MSNLIPIAKRQWLFYLLAKIADISLVRRSLWFLFVISLSGCTRAEAPSFSLLGSYFPSWLACAFIGVIVAVIARVLFIRIGIDDVLPWRLFVYACLALAVAFMFSLILFVR